MTPDNHAASADREIVQSRLYDAPRELVYQAWTSAAHVPHWWGPTGFTTTIHEMDVRPGGVWRFIMHGPDGTDYPNRIVFREVVPNQRLVYDHSGDGDYVDIRFQVTVTFEDQAGKTLLTMRSIFPTAEQRDYVIREHGAIEGGKQTLQRLAEYVSAM